MHMHNYVALRAWDLDFPGPKGRVARFMCLSVPKKNALPGWLLLNHAILLIVVPPKKCLVLLFSIILYR
jgi:hypothetical protein